jgi:hypothetical protein
MKENVIGNTMTGTRICAQCRKSYKTLYYYWYEPDIGGDDKAPRYSLPFCCIEHWREYNRNDILFKSLKANIRGE